MKTKNNNKKWVFLAKKPIAKRLSIAITLSTFILVSLLVSGVFIILGIPGLSDTEKFLLTLPLDVVFYGLLFLIYKRIIRKQTDPIITLAYKANTMAKGHFKTNIPEVDTDNEVARLRDSLEYLQTSVNIIVNDVYNTTARNERIQSEINIASAIQKAMLPQDFPHTKNIDLCAMLSPAKEVGGDLYDFYIKDSKLYFTIGDVSGKGVPAAIYMAITRSSFRFAIGMDMPINEIISRINNVFATGNTTQMFVTMFAGILDLETRKLEFCNAGHNPIIVIDKDGKAQYLRSKSNIAIGLFEDYPYEMETLTLDEGSRILVYTDGVTEAERADKQQYGENRLLDYANSLTKDSTSEEVLDGLHQSVSAFTCGNPQNDDITMMSFLLKNLVLEKRTDTKETATDA